MGKSHLQKRTAQMSRADTPVLTQDDLNLVLFGHAAFQYLRAGCELGLFDLLERSPQLGQDDLQAELGLQDRPMDILLLGATALRLVEQIDGGYRNSPLISSMMSD